MRTIFLLYDAKSDSALRWRAWLDGQTKRCAIAFVPYQAPESMARFAGIEPFCQGHELVAVGEDGAVYPGASAYVCCLAALDGFGEWAQRLAAPDVLPKAPIAGALLTLNDRRLNRMMEGLSDQQFGWFLENQTLSPAAPTTMKCTRERCR